MRYATLQERRNRQILADIVRTYIETGEPVSSRAVSKRFDESLSTATIRNVMADLEDARAAFEEGRSGGFDADIVSRERFRVQNRVYPGELHSESIAYHNLFAAIG